MRVEGTAFEVRCKRCDVTFPVETRTCMHCGGRIDPSDVSDTGLHVGGAPGDERMDSGRMDGRWAPEASAEPIDVMADPFENEAEANEAPQSVGGSIIRSLGGFVWVIVLIGFTIARSCGGE